MSLLELIYRFLYVIDSKFPPDIIRRGDTSIFFSVEVSVDVAPFSDFQPLPYENKGSFIIFQNQVLVSIILIIYRTAPRMSHKSVRLLPLLVVAVCLVWTVNATTTARNPPLQMSDLSSVWAQFLHKFRSEGYSSDTEKKLRFDAFSVNWKNAVDASIANPFATFGIHERSDWTQEELAKLRGFKPNKEYEAHPINPKRIQQVREEYAPRTAKARRLAVPKDPKNLSTPGNAIDWVAEGKVTSVKNQGQCSCCWAFAAIANAESLNAIGGNGLTSLSEQEIVSCYAQNCNGGYIQNAWYWILHSRAGGIGSYDAFPYTSGNEVVPQCHAVNPAQRIVNYENLYSGEVNLYYDVWNIGPIALCLATSTAWDSYTGGVMTDCPQAASDHCINVVGYNLGSSPSYWIIKNSWGTNWGSDGYLYLAYGSNLCSLADYPTTSLV